MALNSYFMTERKNRQIGNNQKGFRATEAKGRSVTQAVLGKDHCLSCGKWTAREQAEGRETPEGLSSRSCVVLTKE